MKKLLFGVVFLLLGATSVLSQQKDKEQIWTGFSDGYSPPRWATEEDFDGSFVFCRGYYEQSYIREDLLTGWFIDYPGADINLSTRLKELTKVKVKVDSDNKPVHVVVRLDSPLIFKCPFVFLSDVEGLLFKDSEVLNLREYFEKGGFMWVDDFWGSKVWNNWEQQIRRVLHPGLYPMRDIPANHPIMRQLYLVPEIPQIPNIGFWYLAKQQTSERYDDSKEVHFRGIDDLGRLMVVMTHNTDIGDTWEREGQDPYGDYFIRFSAIGYTIGINIILYALTH